MWLISLRLMLIAIDDNNNTNDEHFDFLNAEAPEK